jgi:prepilin-type N-terminal cleavage/methylation domain-containing protein
MNNELKTKPGFSLTEILFAVGILAVGMVFIAGVFPVAICFVTIAAERSIAAVAADEAFAKIKLYDVNWTDPNFAVGQTVPFGKITRINDFEFAYPSTNLNPDDKQYYWSALCKRIGSNDVQITVFVCRKTGLFGNRQLPYAVSVSSILPPKPDEISINNVAEKTFINDGYTIVDNATGHIYRVLERDIVTQNKIILDSQWQGSPPVAVWVVPPPVSGGRYPCVAVYQKIIRF